MTQYKEASKIDALIKEASQILIIQPDNPDGDSLGSALALEQIISDLGKETELVCGTKIPSYLSYLPGWDRVFDAPGQKFDLAIVVDTSSLSLLENFIKHSTRAPLSSKPLIVIDHHATTENIEFATVNLNVPAAAAAEVIYELAKQLRWKINLPAMDALVAAILSDTLGLSTDSVTAQTVFAVAEMVEAGVSLSALETARKETMHKSPELVHYKGQLLERIEYFLDDRLALLTIPWSEIERYSPLYNPSMLVIEDMRLTTKTAIAVVLKIYPEGKITGKIRSNFGWPVAGKLAEAFGGGGHDYASGFKIPSGANADELKQEIITKTLELIDATV